MSLTKKTDAVEEGLARLLGQYQGKPILEGLLSAFLEQLQLTEDMLFQLLEARLPADSDDTITGVHLDTLGRLLGQPRNGRSDAEYLKWLRARILVNRSSGTPDEMLSICVIVLPSGTGLLLVEGEDAELSISITQVVENALELAAILDEAKPAAVRFNLLWYQDEDSFQFTTSGTTETDADKGFGDDTITTVGGIFASASAGTR